MVTGPLEKHALPGLSSGRLTALRAQLKLSGTDVDELTRVIRSEGMIPQVKHLLNELPVASQRLVAQLIEES